MTVDGPVIAIAINALAVVFGAGQLRAELRAVRESLQRLESESAAGRSNYESNASRITALEARCTIHHPRTPDALK